MNMRSLVKYTLIIIFTFTIIMISTVKCDETILVKFVDQENRTVTGVVNVSIIPEGKVRVEGEYVRIIVRSLPVVLEAYRHGICVARHQLNKTGKYVIKVVDIFSKDKK